MPPVVVFQRVFILGKATEFGYAENRGSLYEVPRLAAFAASSVITGQEPGCGGDMPGAAPAVVPFTLPSV